MKKVTLFSVLLVTAFLSQGIALADGAAGNKCACKTNFVPGNKHMAAAATTTATAPAPATSTIK